MSELICIGTQTPVQPIETRLQKELSFLQNEGIEVTTETGRSRLFQFIRCHVSYNDISFSEQEGRLLCRQYIANVLTDVLVDEWQRSILERMLCRRYEFFTPADQSAIIDKTMERLASAGHDAPLYLTSRKSRVREALSEYLRRESFVNLDGFLHFRLKPYCAELEEALSQVVDEYLEEKENQEFVRLLRSFLDILEPKHDVVHVLITGSSEFAILDEQGELLRSDLLETVVPGEGGSPEEYEDVMVSSLLTISPRHLILHAGTFLDKPDALKTLKQVFESRVEVCVDCDLCIRLLPQ